ncbi:DUF4097 domain-containing protein [Paenibacillus sp. N4]|uniref:DUF4097 family beta strand repeat-containing protein n=1 Tax=Paenibacillus vietnamensis TaxID=2590547 RepID=UPI001CD0633F|nr:DUF4097 family beta strand repeat-containing protein [Paenibacillus vietnamensis]MCA0756297.1 DUF4097 domain-containing protein [Paenibacillus vietnamensis]
MVFRKKRILLLTSVAVLLVLMILDLTIKKEQLLESFSEPFFNEQRTDAFYLANRQAKATSERQLEIERRELKEVLLAGTGGKIAVERASGDTIRLHYTVTATGADEEAANRRLEAVKVEEEIGEGRLTLAAKSEDKPIDNDAVSIDYVLQVPDGMKLRIDNEEGTVHIAGIRGDVDADSYGGLMEVADVTGNVKVAASYGDLLLSGITGSIDLENLYGEADIEQAKGDVTLMSRSGYTNMSGIEGKIAVDSENGSLHVRETTGQVEVAGRATAVQLEGIRGDMKITADSGYVKLILPQAEGYTLNAALTRSDIRTSLPVSVEREVQEDNMERLTGVIGAGSRKVDIKAESAELVIHSK